MTLASFWDNPGPSHPGLLRVNGHWRKPLLTAALIVVGALILWPIAGATPASLFAATAFGLLLVHHLHNLSEFHEWLLAPKLENLQIGRAHV